MPNKDTGEILEKWDIINSVYPISGVNIHKGGMQVIRTAKGKVGTVKRPKANKVYRLSKKSLCRLAFLASTSNIKFKSLLTLTYERIPTNGREVKEQLNSFLTFLRRRFKHFKIEYLWFLEFQKRGAPHFHVLLNIKSTIVSRETILRKWVDITGGSEKALKVALHKTSWDDIRLEDGAKRYALKYALKQEQKIVPKEYRDVGRFWGNSRGVKSPPEIENWPISENELRRIVNEARPGFSDRMSKFIPKYIFMPNENLT